MELSVANSTRHFIINDGVLEKISRKRINDFYILDKNSLPEYADMVIDLADVLVKIEDRKVIQIIDIFPSRHKVNNQGGLDKEFNRKYLRYLLDDKQNTGIIKDGPIIRAEEVFNKVRYKNTFDWNITPKIVNEIIRVLFK